MIPSSPRVYGEAADGLRTRCRYLAFLTWTTHPLRVLIEEPETGGRLMKVRTRPIEEAASMRANNPTAGIARNDAEEVVFCCLKGVGIEDRDQRKPIVPVRPIGFGELLNPGKVQREAAGSHY